MDLKFLLISLLILLVVLASGMVVQENFDSRIYPVLDDMFMSKKQCYDRYKVKWQPDPNNFKQVQLKKNPFAKKRDSHCRSDVQCQSGHCNEWYCN